MTLKDIMTFDRTVYTQGTIVALRVVKGFAQHPEVIRAYKESGGLSNPPDDWVLKHIFGENAILVR
jgi:hypothetical protein